MIKKIIEYRYPLGSAFFSCLGVMMLIWEVLQLIPCIEGFFENCNLCKIAVFSLIIIVCVYYAYRQLFQKKDELKIVINKRTELTVKKENLMAAPGVRVIPVNEYFDTHNGDGIIKPSSLYRTHASITETLRP